VDVIGTVDGAVGSVTEGSVIGMGSVGLGTAEGSGIGSVGVWVDGGTLSTVGVVISGRTVLSWRSCSHLLVLFNLTAL